jgi:hypothetical protein
MPGMAAWTTENGQTHDERVRLVSLPWKTEDTQERVHVAVTLERIFIGTVFTSTLIPDFSDPATLGCLLYLVREVAKNRNVSAIRSEFRDGSVVWAVSVETRLALEMGLEDGFVRGATEAECLVAVLESLP